MKNQTLIFWVLISLVIGGGAGYFFGTDTGGKNIQTKELQDAMTMMTEQSATIKEMAEMMRTAGISIRETGTKYKDENMIAKGKDLEARGVHYLGENSNADAMPHMMGN